jgi:hypothetical protein
MHSHLDARQFFWEETMFSSTIFDVVFGLVSLFLAVSLFTSAVTEGLSMLVRLRARTLLQGVKQLLNDPDFEGLARSLYNHALVNPLSDGIAKPKTTPSVKPSYIEPDQFALAFVDILKQAGDAAAKAEARAAATTGGTAAGGGAIVAGGGAAASGTQAAGDAAAADDAETLKRRIESAIQKQDPQIQATLATLYRKAGKDVDAFRGEIAAWFDAAMDRLSGVYSRNIKAISFVVALVLAGLLNADAIHVADTLWERPALAERFTKLPSPTVDDPEKEAAALLRQIEGVAPLLGWNGFGSDERRHGWGIVLMVLGWVFVAGAALFGAPFWFDVLQRFVQLRATGPSPDENADDEAARRAAAAKAQAKPAAQ